MSIFKRKPSALSIHKQFLAKAGAPSSGPQTFVEYMDGQDRAVEQELARAKEQQKIDAKADHAIVNAELRQLASDLPMLLAEAVKKNEMFITIPLQHEPRFSADQQREYDCRLGEFEGFRNIVDVCASDEVNARLEFHLRDNPDWDYNGGQETGPVVKTQIRICLNRPFKESPFTSGYKAAEQPEPVRSDRHRRFGI